MLFLANLFGGFFSYEFKPIGVSVQIEDNLLTWAASASSLVQAITRLSFGALYDKYGFKPLFYTLMSIGTINSIICYPARHVPWLYFICILLNYMVLAGLFATFPTPVAKTFGPQYGIQVYSMILVASPIQSIITTTQVKLLYEWLGIQSLIYMGTIGCIMAMVVCFFFDERLDFENMHD